MMPGCPCQQFCCLSKDMRIKRVLKKFPGVLPSNAQPTGMIQKIVGRAQMAPGQILYSPVNNKPCVHYDVKVEERQKRGDNYQWVTIVTEMRTVDFFLSDNTGGSVFVQGATVTPFTMDEKSKTGGGFWGGTSASPGLQALMQRNGRSTTGFFGGNKNLRISEGSFDIGEVLACLGGVNPGVGGPTMMIMPLQQQAITEEYMTANNWDNFDKKSWNALTGKYQTVLMSDSPELTENLLTAQYQNAPMMQQPMTRQQQQPVMIQQQQQQPMMVVQPGQVAPAPTLMNITVPQGVIPGQLIQVQTPSGQLVSVAVPAGVAPGAMFQIQV
jgi:hypothetical protein